MTEQTIASAATAAATPAKAGPERPQSTFVPRFLTGFAILLVWEVVVRMLAPAYVAKPTTVLLAIPSVIVDPTFLQAFGVTEPDAGLDTTKLKTFARKVPGGYSVTGRKIWISTAQVADRILLLARTKRLDEVKKATESLSLFYTKLDRSKVEVRKIDKMGRAAVDTNMLFIDDLFIPEEDRIGEEDKGFEYILHGLNPERILVAAEAVGIGRAALDIATRYAKERVVFGRPIGMNQGVQHPLAQAWMQLESANLMMLKAASRYDAGLSCGAEANAAKYLAAEAGHNACQTAIMTLGGMGYSREYRVERLLRESYIPRIAPVSPQLIMCFIAERVLGLPKSY